MKQPGLIENEFDEQVNKQFCRHGKDHAEIDLHGCPYQHDVNDDDNQEFCRCCPECEQDCTDDI